jgi:putative tricarboxylic transport membrane protein
MKMCVRALQGRSVEVDSVPTGRAAVRRPALAVMGLALIAASTAACTSSGAGGNEDEASGGYPSESLQIMVPASPGGGYDQMARSVQQAMTESGVVDKSIQVYNVPGAGGTVGVSQLASQHKGDPHQLMAMGLVLVGSQKTTGANVTVEDDTTPIAQLASDYLAMVVLPDSPIKTLKDLTDRLKDDPSSVAIAGSSTGSVEHVFMGKLAEAIGVEPTKLNYVPYESGGEQTTSLLSGDTEVNITGVSETVAQLDSGKARAIAVSSPERLDGVDAPTFVEEGYDDELVVANWRGLVAAPGLSEEEQEAIVSLVAEMREKPEWSAILESRGWYDTYKGGDEFEEFLQEESDRMEEALIALGLIDG